MSSLTPEQAREELDQLFADVRQYTPPPAATKTAARPAALPPSNELYSIPEYWVADSHIALIHEETNTLLGNFQSFHHKRDKTARRLVRVTEPVIVTQTEYVRGTQWLFAAPPPLPEPVAHVFTRRLTVDLTLEALLVQADTVELIVHLSYGGITRVELAENTTLHSPDGSHVLHLGGGVNIYPCMGLDAKIALRQAMQMQA